VAESPSNLTITVSKQDGDTIVALAGELDLYTSARLRECLVDLIAGPQASLVVDLAGLDFVDSTGLGTLVGVLKRIRNEGGEMVLRAPSAATRRTIDIAGLARVLPIVD